MAGYLQNQSGATWLYTYHVKTGLYGCILTSSKKGYMTVYLPNQTNNKGLYGCVPTKSNLQRGGYMAVYLPNQTNIKGMYGCVPTKPNLQRGSYMAVYLPNQTNKEGVGGYKNVYRPNRTSKEGATWLCTYQTKQHHIQRNTLQVHAQETVF